MTGQAPWRSGVSSVGHLFLDRGWAVRLFPRQALPRGGGILGLTRTLRQSWFGPPEWAVSVI